MKKCKCNTDSCTCDCCIAGDKKNIKMLLDTLSNELLYVRKNMVWASTNERWGTRDIFANTIINFWKNSPKLEKKS